MPATDALFQLSGEVLPADARVQRYRAREAVSQPFEVEVDFSTLDSSFDVTRCLRESLLLSIVDGAGRARYFHGVCERAEFVDLIGQGANETRLYFRVLLRPALAALAHRENSKIWQFNPTPDVIKDVLAGAGVDKVEWKAYQSYDQREFVVQYRESELAFISRLLEDEGLFYFFRHGPEGHVMIVADDPDAFKVPDGEDAVVLAMDSGLGLLGEPLGDFSRTRALRTGHVALRDYDFEKPQNAPVAGVDAEERWPMRRYHYPGGFTKSAEGKRRAAAMLASRRRDSDVCRGRSSAIGLHPGAPFRVEGGEPEWVNGEFVCIELLTYGEQSSAAADHNFACKNAFTGVPVGAPWAPARVTPRPRIRGIQTAVVTGSSGDDQSIHTDKFGRIKVRFHWDRIGQHDHNSSCWLRTQQLATGGSMLLPRVGWEMAVAFLDGDPDRPFCLGRIYNGEQSSALGLPANKASGSIRSHSSPGGGGANEIKMGDSGGGQGHGIKAQKDFNVTIGHDKNETIGVDEEHNVKVNLSTSVGSNETITVSANQTVTIGAMLSHKIGGSQSITVGGMESDDATANYVEKMGGNRSYTVGANQIVICNGIKTTGKGGITRTIGAASIRGAVGSISDNVGGSYTETVGAVRLEVIKGVSSETVGGLKSQQIAAAEVHLIDGNQQSSCDAAVTQMIGGLHYQNIAGDYSVKAPMITLLGAVGVFKGGGSELKLGGAPVVMKGSKIAIKAAMVIKMGSSLKMGSG